MAGGHGFWTPTSPGGGGTAVAELLATKSHNPAVAVNTAATATLAAIDTTNLRITFTVPASGAVIVSMSGYLTLDNTEAQWGLLEGASTVTGSLGQIGFGALNARVTYRVRISGLTPGASKTWDWAHRESFNATAGFRVGGDGGQALMEVWSA